MGVDIDIALLVIYATNTRGAGERNLRNFIIIGATATGLGGYIVSSKAFLSRSIKWIDVVISRNNQVICSSQPPYWIRHFGFLGISKTVDNRSHWLSHPIKKNEKV